MAVTSFLLHCIIDFRVCLTFSKNGIENDKNDYFSGILCKTLDYWIGLRYNSLSIVSIEDLFSYALFQ